MSDKEPKQYTVITSAGYWGKGETPVEAARSANVSSKAVNGSLYYAHQMIDGEVDCTGMGGTEIKWTDQAWESIQNNDTLRSVGLNAMKLAGGEMRITKGKLQIKSEF